MLGQIQKNNGRDYFTIAPKEQPQETIRQKDRKKLKILKEAKSHRRRKTFKYQNRRNNEYQGNKKKTRMLQIPVNEKEFEILKARVDKWKRSLPNSIKIILKPYLKAS